MSKKYVGAVLRPGRIKGSMRYIADPKKARNVKRALAQAAEKATHGRIQAGEIYRDDLIEAIVEVLLESAMPFPKGKDPRFPGRPDTLKTMRRFKRWKKDRDVENRLSKLEKK